MKKIIAGLVLGSVLLMNTAFAGNNENVNEKVAAAFKHEFVEAKEVTWEKADNYYKAVFKLNDDVLTAYFSTSGELMGVVRNLLSTDLPIGLQTSLKRDYEGYWITDLFEYARKDASGYFVTIENADQRLTLQSSDGRNWSTYVRSKK
jgi:hypothetical protein